MEDDLIDFNVIEGQKENIQALPSGRSAKALAQLYSPPLLGLGAKADSPLPLNDQHSEKRAEFEKEVANIDEADDPLDVYDRYVKWTLDTYPSAQATPQSRLLPLLERATKTFQSSKDYKNDPRYLKIWLHYIRLFHDSPREVFVFLARQGIGENLALYYEEFAAWLENAGRYNQAEEIYKLGIEKEARPTERLMRKFGEFERRKDARPQPQDAAAEPSSPALPVVRPVLAAKLDPFSESSSPAQQAQLKGTKKPKSSKMAIFTDDGDEARPASGNSSKGWDSIGTLADRKKENAQDAKPWAGETLKTGKTNGGVQKMMIFKDQSIGVLPRHLLSTSSSSNHGQQLAFNEATGRMECVFVNLEAVYPDPGNLSVEYCFEELRARHRGWPREASEKVEQEEKPMPTTNDSFSIHLDTPEQPEVQEAREDPLQENADESSKSKHRGFKIFEDDEATPEPQQRKPREGKVSIETSVKTLSLNDENDENTPPSKQDVDLAKKLRREERQNRTRKIKVIKEKHIKNETQTIKLNMDSPQSKPKRRKSVAPEPTMTIATKEAMEEIYGIFNQPVQAQQPQETEYSDESSEDEDDYTTDGESTATGKLSAAASEFGDETRNELLGAEQSETDADRTDVSAWSDFTSSKHVPREDTESAIPSAQNTTREGFSDQLTEDDEHIATPVDENLRTESVPLQSEDYEPPLMQMRDMHMLPNHRLPFMTPIPEQTESSLGGGTQRSENDFFSAKTPSRKNGMPQEQDEDDEIPSSPFEDITTDLPPIRTKSTKGMLKLGQGTAKSQMDAKVDVPIATDPIQKGPIVKDTQCNPMDPSIRHNILSQMNPPLSSFEGYYEDVDFSFGKTAEVKKWIKSQAKSKNSQSQSQEKVASLPPTIDLPRAQGKYTIKRELGAGTFAPVYLIENSVAAAAAEEDLLLDENAAPLHKVGKASYRKPLEAIKMEDPPSTWEFYILRATHRRLGISRAAESIVRAHEMHLFRDECFLVEEFRDQGTLLDLVNIARLESGNGGGMDEMLAMWFTVELLRVTEAMHSKQLIHGDLKGDNVLVRFDEPSMETDWNATYFPSGAHGWSSKGVCLIDFGRGIDMKQFVPNVGFIADWKTSEADCAEMRELRPWTYQIDYHGLAGIIHSMLFGKYMETVGEKGASLGHGATKTYRIRESLKRYWQTEIWTEAFQLLLNPLQHVDKEEGQKMPVLNGMRGVRERMEGWLEENCERGVGLKGMIGRMEAVIREKKRRSGRV